MTGDPRPELVATLQALRELLTRHGVRYHPATLISYEERLQRNDRTAIASIISDVTGGMGSLNDRIISYSNGDNLDGYPEAAINARLRLRIEQLSDQARAARNTPWFRLTKSE
jgi:hypothetical protein